LGGYWSDIADSKSEDLFSFARAMGACQRPFIAPNLRFYRFATTIGEEAVRHWLDFVMLMGKI
jgi:hypothetical protein